MTGHDILEIGIPEGPLVGLALSAAKACKAEGISEDEIRALFTVVLGDPAVYAKYNNWLGALAHGLIKHTLDTQLRQSAAPRDEPLPYSVFGSHLIDDVTREQMDTAMRLPVAVDGALMPDAHLGYGLPVGGVLTTDHAVIPYAVGVDIACRMMLTLYPFIYGVDVEDKIKRAMVKETAFGQGAGFDTKRQHGIMDDPRWNELPILRRLKNQAWHQLGSSGGGNHFADFGIVELRSPVDGFYAKVQTGTYFALMTHSGSRALGFKIANHYTKIAKQKAYGLPREMEHLAWLDLDSEAGQEYWLAMNFAGDYASANHHLIHDHFSRAAGLNPIWQVENHHNFAWKERHGGRTVVVHRKGATPAGRGVFGLIPGSMADAGYIVSGKGNAESLSSASHGAGRAMSRTQAKKTISPEEARRYLDERGVELLGGGLDEAPTAYKNIETVIAAQTDLVDVIGKFTPRIVLMAGDNSPF